MKNSKKGIIKQKNEIDSFQNHLSLNQNLETKKNQRLEELELDKEENFVNLVADLIVKITLAPNEKEGNQIFKI